MPLMTPPSLQLVPSATGRFSQLPLLQRSVVDDLLSSHPLTHSRGGGGGWGAPQPETWMPKPGSETMTCPSALTRAMPPETNCSSAWSKEKISSTCPGASASVFGSCTLMGLLKCRPAGCNVQTSFGAVPLGGGIGTLSACTCEMERGPTYGRPS